MRKTTGHGWACRGTARLGGAKPGRAERGELGRGPAWHDMGRTATSSASAWVRWGMPVGITWSGPARPGEARRGGERHGMERGTL